MNSRFLIKKIAIISILSLCFTSCKKNDYGNNLLIISTDTIFNITQTTANITSEISSDGVNLVTARGVCWGTVQLPTIQDNKTEDSSGVGSFTSSIEGLLADTEYNIRAYAINDAGTNYGNLLTFTTPKPFPENGSIVKDIDDNSYHTLVIGNQVWLQENLKTSKYTNGEPVINFTDTTAWAWGNITYGAYSNYNNDTSLSNVYGKLYNWYSINDTRGVCPDGWHIPSKTEWEELINVLGGAAVAGGKLKETGTAHWLSPNTGATNEFGFTALPSGFREVNGAFQSQGYVTYIWTSTETIDYGLGWGEASIGFITSMKNIGLSVRCTMDK
jgi:uncharacterized protein (TIGR02145 family)